MSPERILGRYNFFALIADAQFERLTWPTLLEIDTLSYLASLSVTRTAFHFSCTQIQAHTGDVSFYFPLSFSVLGTCRRIQSRRRPEREEYTNKKKREIFLSRFFSKHRRIIKGKRRECRKRENKYFYNALFEGREVLLTRDKL